MRKRKKSKKKKIVHHLMRKHCLSSSGYRDCLCEKTTIERIFAKSGFS